MSGGVLLAVLSSLLGVVVLLLLGQTWRLRRRQEDLALTAEALVRQESMVALGRMLAGVAHELNTPLGAVSCAVGTQQKAVAVLARALADLGGDGDRAAALAQAEKALRALQSGTPVLDEALLRTHQLVCELRLAGRGEQPAAEPVDVNALVGGTLLLLRHELKNAVEVRTELGEIPPVMGWPGPLGQVLLNLVLNARQATGDGGEITIATDVQDGRVRVRVTDNGPGLPAGCAARIFEPGFTTKSPAEGTGLGLFISRKIVARHRGELSARNRDTGGAEFTLLLPTDAG